MFSHVATVFHRVSLLSGSLVESLLSHRVLYEIATLFHLSRKLKRLTDWICVTRYRKIDRKKREMKCVEKNKIINNKREKKNSNERNVMSSWSYIPTREDMHVKKYWLLVMSRPHPPILSNSSFFVCVCVCIFPFHSFLLDFPLVIFIRILLYIQFSRFASRLRQCHISKRTNTRLNR